MMKNRVFLNHSAVLDSTIDEAKSVMNVINKLSEPSLTDLKAAYEHIRTLKVSMKNVKKQLEVESVSRVHS